MVTFIKLFNFLLFLMNKILSKKNIWLSIKLQLVSVIFLLYIVIFLSNNNSKKLKNFLHFGLSTNETPINIFGVSIDNNKKYFLLISWIILSEAINTWTYKIYKNWYRNKLLDPKSKEVGMKKNDALIITNLWEFLTYIPRIFNLFLIFRTGQLQFLIPAFITRRIVSTYIDSLYLNKINNIEKST